MHLRKSKYIADKIRIFTILFSALGVTATISAQSFKNLFENSTFSAQVQADVQYCFKDSVKDPSEYADKFLSHLYIDAVYNSRMISAGARFEMYENPLPGFEQSYKGYGIPNFYLTLNINKVSVTGGDFYEQFGSGLILRTYEERLLGIDNALRGGRIIYTPFPWLTLKGIAGIQRYCWKWSDSRVLGADMEMNTDQWIRSFREKGRNIQIGGSFVSRHERDEVIMASPDKRLNLPANVGAFSVRMRYNTPTLTLESEYAWKANDPSSDNDFIYRPGQVLVLSASYSKKGFGISLAAKHCDNMSFRSERTASGIKYQLNYLPAFTRQHTYALAALYPYATQMNGEVAFQATASYKFKKGTVLGGEHGMDIRFNYSEIFSLYKNFMTGEKDNPKGTYGYTTSFFAIGDDIYYRDINIEMSRRLNSDFKLTLMYMNQLYNNIIIGKSGIINSNIIVAELLWKMPHNLILRTELQTLLSPQAGNDWIAGVIELSVAPHWIFTFSDMYNISGENYPLGSVAFSTGTHRIQLTGGKQREGYNCAGGVCRYVPATTGFALGYTASF